jgi:hypothetical protein
MKERYILKKGSWAYDFIPRDYYVIELQAYLSVNTAVRQVAPSAINCLTADMIKSRLWQVSFNDQALAKAVCTSLYDCALFDAWRSLTAPSEHQTLYIHRNQETMHAVVRDVNNYGLTAGYSYYSRYPRTWEKITEVIVDGQCWIRKPGRS